MNIGDMNFHVNTAGNYVSGGASAPISGGTPNQALVGGEQQVTGNNLMAAATEGQTFTGEVVNVTGQEVSIMLDGDKMLNAHMAESVNLNIGDSFTFLVQENNGTNVLIRPLPTQQFSANIQTIQKVLDANHFLPTEKNFQIADTLMQHGMPLDKNTMQQIMQQSIKYPDVKLETLVNMNKLNLPVNESTIGQYNSYMENTHQLANAISDLTDSVTQFSGAVLNEMAHGSADTGEILAFQNKLISIIGDDQTGQPVGETVAQAAEAGTGAAEGAAMAEAVPTETVMPETVTANPAGNEFLAAKNVTADTTALSEQIELLAKAASEGEDTQPIIKEITTEIETKLQAFKESLAAEVDNAPLQAEAETKSSPAELLKEVGRMLNEHADALPKETALEILRSDAYTSLLHAAVKEKMTLHKDSLQSADEIDLLYQKLYDKSNKLMESFQEMGGKAGDEMQKQAGSMKERLDFMQNLNEMFAYAQLPMRLTDEAFNSELFVYMNKNRQKSAKEAVSALLHLDMEHLGPTDVHVSLHGTVVNTKFYVEDPVSAKILDDHMNQLEQAVAETGFTLTKEVIMREPTIMGTPNAVVNEMLGKDLEKSIKRYSFDVRM